MVHLKSLESDRVDDTFSENAECVKRKWLPDRNHLGDSGGKVLCDCQEALRHVLIWEPQHHVASLCGGGGN